MPSLGDAAKPGRNQDFLQCVGNQVKKVFQGAFVSVTEQIRERLKTDISGKGEMTQWWLKELAAVGRTEFPRVLTKVGQGKRRVCRGCRS